MNVFGVTKPAGLRNMNTELLIKQKRAFCANFFFLDLFSFVLVCSSQTQQYLVYHSDEFHVLYVRETSNGIRCVSTGRVSTRDKVRHD